MFVFVDIETTGLDHRVGEILEIAALMTSERFDVVGPPFHAVFRPYRHDWLDLMEPGVTNMHIKSGLIHDVELEGLPRNVIIDAFRDWFPSHVESPMCGSSVHFDRRWLAYHCPEIEAEFSYRNLDVSSISQWIRVTNSQHHSNRPIKVREHRAMPDLLETLDELRHYGTIFEGVRL